MSRPAKDWTDEFQSVPLPLQNQESKREEGESSLYRMENR